MDVLLTGNLAPVSQGFVHKVSEDCKCVLYSEKEKRNMESGNVTVYKRTCEEDDMERVFSTFDFGTVLYFSQALDGAVKIFDELEKLESTLYLCRKMKIENFVYLTTNDLQTERQREEGISREILMQACENLCKSFSEKTAVKILILRLPYIYSRKVAENSLYHWVLNAVQKKEILFRGIPEQHVDFLCDEDLGELIARILDEPVHKEFEVANISGGNEVSFLEIEETIHSVLPDAEYAYGNHMDSIPICLKNDVARTEYSWYPKRDVREDLKELLEHTVIQEKKKRKTYERRKRMNLFREKLRITLEIIVVFLIAEGLNFWLKDNVLLNFLDFRLIFVVLMGTINGLNAGVFAAVLASVGYVFGSATTTQWQVLFYNVQNWLPFACYFLLGSMCGYNKDRHDDEILYAKEEQEILENKYVFLNKLYQKVLDSKDNFSSQIIGYKDSFGKLYAIVKRLDSVLPDQIFYEAVSVLEEGLGNYNVAIYTIYGKSDFARLNVCSKNLNQELGKSMKLSDYPVMTKQLYDSQFFVNNMNLKGYPAYAAPILREGELLGMILLVNAEDYQMSMEFSNKFHIISDLIRDSLIRATEFEELSDHYIPHTQILMPEAFQNVREIKEQMQEKQYMEYVLLHIISEGRPLAQTGDVISRMVRANDVLGTDFQGELFLLLCQTRSSDIQVVEDRMKKHHINFEVVKG